MGDVIDSFTRQLSVDGSQELKAGAVDCHGVGSREQVAEMRFPAAVTQFLSVDKCFGHVNYEDVERFERRSFSDAFVQIHAAGVQAGTCLLYTSDAADE